MKVAESSMRSFLLILMAALFCVTAVGQATREQCLPDPDTMEGIVQLPITRNSDFDDPRKLLPARGGQVDLGLALSGGGIRSASFSIGVMKALYGDGFFDDVDAISTVSGGGYALYWLLGLNNSSEDGAFGARAFANAGYIRNTCDLTSSSDMYSLRKMARSLISRKRGAFFTYQSRIHRTFGRRDCGLSGQTVSSIYREGMPYFFINASLSTKEMNGLGKSVEITPDYIGNNVLGYSLWKSDEQAINLSKAITASGAGIEWKLKKDVPNFVPFTVNDDNLRRQPSQYLHDGGKSENLAALPLIRRGLSKVVIVDGEHDPRYGFEGYCVLKKHLLGYEIDFEVPEIEKFFDANSYINCKERRSDFAHPTGVMHGTAKGPKGVTEIFYVKLSRPTSIFPHDSKFVPPAKRMTKDERDKFLGDWLPSGASLAIARRKAFDEAQSGQKCNAMMDAGYTPEMYQYLTNRYAYFLIQSKWRHAALVRKLIPFDVTYDFPHITTMDQSYYSDQMEALIGLGFLQGKELVRMLGSSTTSTK